MDIDSDKSAADTDYSKALETLMKECLPPILVEIVDKRPLDPIEYMANALYNFKEKSEECLERNIKANSLSNTHLKSHHPSDGRKEKSGHQISVTEQCPKKVSIDECEDFEPVNIKTKIHHDCLDIFRHIGDIFDEEDIS